MIRLIIWLIILYIFAKVVGVFIQLFRSYFSSNEKLREKQPPGKPIQHYGNVQDAEYEDISEKKKD